MNNQQPNMQYPLFKPTPTPTQPITTKKAKNKKFIHNHTNLADEKAAKFKALNGLEMLFTETGEICKALGNAQITRIYNSMGVIIGYVHPDNPDKIATVMGNPEDDVKIYSLRSLFIF